MFLIKKYFCNSFIVLVTSMLVIGCIKDKISLPDQPISNYVDVYMPQAAKAPLEYTFNVNDTSENYMIYGAYFSGLKVADKDISVIFDIGANLVDSFNLNNNSDYVLLPTNRYTINDLNTTIRKGSVSTDPLKIVILKNESNTIDYSKTYILPIYIKNATVDISEKLSTTFFIIHFTN